MAHPDTITYLPHHQINKTLWDRCIDTASNGLVYGYSVFLDHMAGQWDGIVVNDYEAVMPLPWRKKFGISYLYQPFLTAQLGLFGNHLNSPLLQSCLDAIPRRFRLWEFPLNHQNWFPETGYPLYQRKNYVLDLQQPYETLRNAYRENVKRNIRKAQQVGCTEASKVDVQQVIGIAKEQNGAHPGFADFEKLFAVFQSKGMASCYGIVSKQNELLASCAVLQSHGRIYYLLVGNHPNGRTVGASHALIDAIIQDHAEKNRLLDFEGSDIRNLAFFYSSFGAVEELYAAIRWDQLPWYARLFKK